MKFVFFMSLLKYTKLNPEGIRKMTVHYAPLQMTRTDLNLG